MRFSAEASRDTFVANVEGFDCPIGLSNLIDLSERFRPRQPAEAAAQAQEPDTDFQAHVDRLLAEKPPQWLEFAFWGVVTVMFTGGVLGICACLYS